MLGRVSRNQTATAVFVDVWRASHPQPNWFRIGALAFDGAIWVSVAVLIARHWSALAI